MDLTHTYDSIEEALQIFKPVNVDRGTKRVNYVDYRPVNQLTQTSPLEFNIPASPTQYMDLRRCGLKAKIRVTALGGGLLEEGDVVTMTNNMLDSLFS